MANLILLPFAQTTDERIQNQIEAFRTMFLTQEGDVENANQMIDVIIEYLSQFDDDNLELNQAYVKLQEAHFWLDGSMSY